MDKELKTRIDNKEENEKLREQIEDIEERVKKLELYYTRLRGLTVTIGLDILKMANDSIMGCRFLPQIEKVVSDDEYLPCL